MLLLGVARCLLCVLLWWLANGVARSVARRLLGVHNSQSVMRWLLWCIMLGH